MTLPACQAGDALPPCESSPQTMDKPRLQIKGTQVAHGNRHCRTWLMATTTGMP